jgi:transcription initiation factor IIE alpha subunit
MHSLGEPPDSVTFGLEEALDLLASLEDCRYVLVNTDHLSVLSQVEHQIQLLSRKLGVDKGGPDVQ